MWAYTSSPAQPDQQRLEFRYELALQRIMSLLTIKAAHIETTLKQGAMDTWQKARHTMFNIIL